VTPPRAMTLVQLIDKAATLRGTTSTHRLAKYAREAGHRISHTTIAAIRKGTYPSAPSGETLSALAFLAGVPEHVAQAAAGLPVAGVPFARQLPQDVELLRPDQRDAVLGVIRALVSVERQLRDRDDGTESTGRPGTARRTVLRDKDDPLLHRDDPDAQEDRI
jgi:hypothetical protein